MPTITCDMVNSLKTLRTFYAKDNPLGSLLDTMSKALESGQVEDEVISDAEKMLNEIDPSSTASTFITLALASLTETTPEISSS